MATFAYKAVDQNGREATGTLEASARSAAVDDLVGKGLYPVSVEESGRTDSRARTLPMAGSVSQSSVQAFTRELANLLAAGVPLSKSLLILSREASQPAARKLWAAVHDDVVEGMSVADALGRWPRSFPPVYVAMVRAGETGGFLDVVLGQIADFRSREQDLKGKVKAVLVYPSVLAVLACMVLVFLLTYFIPRFSGIFAELGGRLPLLTRAIMSVSDYVMNYALMIVIAVVLIIVSLRRAFSSESGRRTFERVMLSIPVLGHVTARLALVRFCRMLGTLINAGVPLVAALQVAKEAIGNQTLADTVTRAVEDVKRGSPLARSLSGNSQLFPASVAEMVIVAEETGRLDKELTRLASVYEVEVDRRLRMLVALVEPVLLFVMAALIGTVVVGMLLPIFTLQDLIR